MPRCEFPLRPIAVNRSLKVFDRLSGLATALRDTGQHQINEAISRLFFEQLLQVRFSLVGFTEFYQSNRERQAVIRFVRKEQQSLAILFRRPFHITRTSKRLSEGI